MRLRIAPPPLKSRARALTASLAHPISHVAMTRSSVLACLALLLLGAALLPSADAQAILAPSYINPYDAGWNAIIAGTCKDTPRK